MSDHYPPLTPKWAASIWATDAWLYLEMPSMAGIAKHTVRVTNDAQGLAQALEILNYRNSESRIGEKGDPTRWQLNHRDELPLYDERMVKKVRPKDTFTAEARIVAREILRKVGIL
jgi:hypothetical protein